MNLLGHQGEGGKSSFGLFDPQELFKVMDLQPRMSFLDLGCGKGEFALEAAEYLGAAGRVYAVDRWAEGIGLLEAAAAAQGITNIKAWVGEFDRRLPLDDASIDCCLMGSVLHGVIRNRILKQTMNEVKRVLKPGGRLVITEWQKLEAPFGPPIAVKITPAEVVDYLNPFGFSAIRIQALGAYMYVVSLGIPTQT